jgi:hypothetical protein
MALSGALLARIQGWIVFRKNSTAPPLLVSAVRVSTIGPEFQEMLGHARVSITLDLYSHLMPSLQAASAELFDKALSKMAKASKCAKSV